MDHTRYTDRLIHSTVYLVVLNNTNRLEISYASCFTS